MERGHLDPVLDKRLHHRVHLRAREHEITHDHGIVAHRLECEPGAKREARLDLDAIEGDLQVGTRQADPINSAGLERTLLAEGLSDRFPVGLGCGRNRNG